MKTLFKKENLKNTILTLVYLIFGVALLVSPVKMFNFVESALCFVLLAVGIVCVFIYSLMSADDKILKLLIYGVLGLLIGLCMMLVPRLFGVLLSLIVGYSGVSMIVSGVKLKKAGQKTWITDFVIGVVVSALSVTTIVLSLIGSAIGRNILAIFFGIILLTNGIYNLVQIILMLKKQRINKKKELAEKAVSGEETTEIVEEQPVEKQETIVEEVKPETVEDESMKKIKSAKRKIVKKQTSKK
jgi:uncharacterized membrane protein HdeD (DUF308 family)